MRELAANPLRRKIGVTPILLLFTLSTELMAEVIGFEAGADKQGSG